MTPTSARRTFHYKTAKFTSEQRPLQDCLAAALKVKHLAKDRFQKIGLDGATIRLINTTSTHHGMLIGEMFDYTPGNNQPICLIDETAEALSIKQLPPSKDKNDARKEFVESFLYFGVLGNHVVMLQSSSLRASQFENYINWLLNGCTQTIDKQEVVTLDDQPPREIRKKGYHSVKAIAISAPPSVDTSPGRTTLEQVSSMALPVSALDILKTALGDRLNNASLPKTFASALKERDLELRLQLIRRRGYSEDGQIALDTIANIFRHHDGTDLTINLDHGGTVKGSDFKISDAFGVKMLAGMPVHSDLFEKMFGWLESLIKSGKIKVD